MRLGGGVEMAAASTAISCVACQRIRPAPRLPRSSKPTSWCSGGQLCNSVSLTGISGLPPPLRHRDPQLRKRLLISRRRTVGWGRARRWGVVSVAAEDLDAIPARGVDATDLQEGLTAGGGEKDCVAGSSNSHAEMLASEGGVVEDAGVGLSSVASFSPPGLGAEVPRGPCVEQTVDRAINAIIVLASGTAVVTRLLTIDHDYWHGWTLYEILRYAPQHNWTAYEEALKTHPVLAKMMISGIVYSLGDWIAQCYEGKPLFEFDRVRMFRSGLVGFTLHGSLSHYYYHFCEAIFPFQDWWVVPAKVAFDQTAWSAFWNSIYYVVLGFLRFESPANILTELKATFWSMLTAGWKLWPFAHLITYGVIPVEQRLLWVDCVELIWVTILSTYSNEKSEARNLEATLQTNKISIQANPEENAE